MNIVTQINHVEQHLSNEMLIFFREYKIGDKLRRSNAYKQQGFSVISIFIVAFCTVFLNRSFYSQLQSRSKMIEFGKDTMYRFFKSYNTNWRKFTLLLGKDISKDISELNDEGHKNVLIIDDTFYSRLRAKKAELLAKVYDHAHNIFGKGYRLLVLGWSDGNTFLPINHCLLSTENDKCLINGSDKSVPTQSNGGKQRKLARTKGTQVMLTLLREAKEAGIKAKYVLFDTWFCSPSSLIAIRDIDLHVIAMTKKSSTNHFRYKGKMLSVQAIYSNNRKKRGRSKYLLAVEAEAVKDGKKIPVKLVYVRNRNNRKQYLVLVTTDVTLDPKEVIRIYGKRWSIEVFFKVCKSYLRLSKECRAISYDSMTAHTAIVFTRYMFLALQQRREKDPRSIGELFYISNDALEDIKFIDAVALILTMFAETIKTTSIFEENRISELLDEFIESLPDRWNRCLKQCA